MDIVHHAVIGIIGLHGYSAAGHETAGIFFLIGSVLPDLDVLLMFLGKRAYLKNHQGFSHSLLLLPFFALAVVALMQPVIPFEWTNLLAIMLGILLHTLLDYTNTYGISLFYPLSKKRISLDAVFFIDAVLLFLSISMLVFEYPLSLYLSLFGAYVLSKIILRNAVHQKLHATHTIPSALHPFEFYIYEEHNGQIITYLYNALNKKKRHYHKQANMDGRYRHLLTQSRFYKDIQKITKALHVTDVSEENHTVTLQAKDMALRNFGGKFATTTLVFDKKGELIDETSHI